ARTTTTTTITITLSPKEFAMQSRNGRTMPHRASRSKSARLELLFLATVTAAFGGCTVGPNYRAPQTMTPASWLSATVASATTMPAAANGPGLIVSQEAANLTNWWTVLGDKTLDSMLAEAIQ